MQINQKKCIFLYDPDSIRQHYQQLTRYEARMSPALPPSPTLGTRLWQHRQHLDLTLTQAAEQLGVSPSYLHRLEQGHRGKRPTAKLQQVFESWLGTSRSQDDTPPA